MHPAQEQSDSQAGRAATAPWWRRRSTLRPVEEIEAQYEAAHAFSGEVTAMLPTSHQYTAGQAAALAWLLGRGPAPLDFPELGGAAAEAAPLGAGSRTAGRTAAASVARLAERARDLMEGSERGELFPPAYVMGVDFVCTWALGNTDIPPIPAPTDGRSL